MRRSIISSRSTCENFRAQPLRDSVELSTEQSDINDDAAATTAAAILEQQQASVIAAAERTALTSGATVVDDNADAVPSSSSNKRSSGSSESGSGNGERAANDVGNHHDADAPAKRLKSSDDSLQSLDVDTKPVAARNARADRDDDSSSESPVADEPQVPLLVGKCVGFCNQNNDFCM